MKRVVKLKTAEKGLLLSCLVDGAVHVMWIHLDVDATSTWDDIGLIHTCLIHTYIHTVYGRKCSRVTSCQVGRQQEVPVRSNSKGKREMHLCVASLPRLCLLSTLLRSGLRLLCSSYAMLSDNYNGIRINITTFRLLHTILLFLFFEKY